MTFKKWQFCYDASTRTNKHDQKISFCLISAFCSVNWNLWHLMHWRGGFWVDRQLTFCVFTFCQPTSVHLTFFTTDPMDYWPSLISDLMLTDLMLTDPFDLWPCWLLTFMYNWPFDKLPFWQFTFLYFWPYDILPFEDLPFWQLAFYQDLPPGQISFWQPTF